MDFPNSASIIFYLCGFFFLLNKRNQSLKQWSCYSMRQWHNTSLNATHCKIQEKTPLCCIPRTPPHTRARTTFPPFSTEQSTLVGLTGVSAGIPATINLKKPDFLDGILIGPYICIMPCSLSIAFTERDTKGSKTFLSPLPNNSLMWILTDKQAGDYSSTEEGEVAC